MSLPLDVPHARDLWLPRRQLTLDQARRRSEMVKVVRMVFTSGAAISLGFLVGPILAGTLFAPGKASVSYRGDEVVTMINPRFTGRDTDGSAFVITAESAQRVRASDDLVDLVNPTLFDEFGGRITAPTGRYDQVSQTLVLAQDVTIKDAAGYVFSTANARIFLKEGRVQGPDPLMGSGPLGDIRSDAYEISDDGGRVRFTGNVQMTLYPKDKAPEAPPATQVPPAETPAEDGHDG